MPTRNVVLTDHQESLIHRLVATGRYRNASEVMRDALRALERRRQSRSFAENQAKTVADHRAQVAVIDGREARAVQELRDRQRSLAGRVVGLVRGRKHQLGRQEALEEQFEAQRAAKQRQLAELLGRQDAAKQRAWDSHAKD